MKTIKIVLTLLLLGSLSQANAQFLKRLGKIAEEAAARTVERKVDEKTERKTEKTFDTIFNNKERKRKLRNQRRAKRGLPPIPQSQEENYDEDGNLIYNDTSYPDENYDESTEQGQPPSVNRPSDFEAGTTILFSDNFSDTRLGDFPAKWDTNGSGNIAEYNGQRWLQLSGNSKYIPMTEQALPENYTVAFDLYTKGLDGKTSSNAYLTVLLEDNAGFTKPTDWCMTELSVCQFIGNLGVVEKVENGKRQLRNQIGKDYRESINGLSHISIAVNKTRLRVWLNENKIIDVPRLIPEGASVFKLATRGLRDPAGLDEVYISNFTIAAAGLDNRSKLITEGRLTSNAILFEYASATLKGQSYGEIAKIAQVLKEHPEVRIQIIGHTDDDGPEATNINLSKERASAVRQALITAYGIDSDRMQTDGLGESQPVAPNNTGQGKALNRRVEFIKL